MTSSCASGIGMTLQTASLYIMRDKQRGTLIRVCFGFLIIISQLANVSETNLVNHSVVPKSSALSLLLGMNTKTFSQNPSLRSNCNRSIPPPPPYIMNSKQQCGPLVVLTRLSLTKQWPTMQYVSLLVIIPMQRGPPTTPAAISLFGFDRNLTARL